MFLAQATTFIPRRQSSFATPAPIPADPPVTRATRPDQRSITFVQLQRRSTDSTAQLRLLKI